MRAVGNKTCLSDSFESQKKAARAVANGLLTNEVRGGRKMEVKKVMFIRLGVEEVHLLKNMEFKNK